MWHWNLSPLPCLSGCPCETWRHLTPRIILIIYLAIKQSKREEAAASRFGHFCPLLAVFGTVVAVVVAVVAVLLMLKIVKFNKLPAIFIAPGPGTSIDCECFCFGFFRFSFIFFLAFWLSNLFMTSANIFQFLTITHNWPWSYEMSRATKWRTYEPNLCAIKIALINPNAAAEKCNSNYVDDCCSWRKVS